MDIIESFRHAIKQGDVEKVKEYIEKDPTLVNAQFEPNYSAVLEAVYSNKQQIVDLLIINGAHLNIFEAAASGETGDVRDWVRDDPCMLNTISHDGWTPLHLAAYFNRHETVLWLLHNNASRDIVSQNNLHVTPLQSALANRNVEVALSLLDHDASPNAIPGAHEWSPLHYAAVNNMPKVVKRLLELGADKHAEAGGKTPLDFAREHGNDRIVELLS